MELKNDSTFVPYIMTTRDLVKLYRDENPKMKASEIGRKIGVSRQRISELLREMGMETKILLPIRYCQECKNPIDRDNRNGKFCSLACYYKQGRTQLVCTECGREYHRCSSTIKRKGPDSSGDFCTRVCYGLHLSKRYGFGRKNDVGIVMAYRMQTGLNHAKRAVQKCLSNSRGHKSCVPEDHLRVPLQKIAIEAVNSCDYGRMQAYWYADGSSLLYLPKYKEKSHHVMVGKKSRLSNLVDMNSDGSYDNQIQKELDNLVGE